MHSGGILHLVKWRGKKYAKSLYKSYSGSILRCIDVFKRLFLMRRKKNTSSVLQCGDDSIKLSHKNYIWIFTNIVTLGFNDFVYNEHLFITNKYFSTLFFPKYYMKFITHYRYNEPRSKRTLVITNPGYAQPQLYRAPVIMQTGYEEPRL